MALRMEWPWNVCLLDAHTTAYKSGRLRLNLLAPKTQSLLTVDVAVTSAGARYRPLFNTTCRRELSKGNASLYTPCCHSAFHIVDGLMSTFKTRLRSMQNNQMCGIVFFSCLVLGHIPIKSIPSGSSKISAFSGEGRNARWCGKIPPNWAGLSSF